MPKGDDECCDDDCCCCCCCSDDHSAPELVIVRGKPRYGKLCWFVADCAGIFCASFTFFLLVYAFYCCSSILLSNAESLSLGIVTFTLAVAMVSHLRAVFTNPGTIEVPPEEIAEAGDLGPVTARGKRFCKKCERFKPERAHHCSTCGVCVRNMDHHCPWVNNCVGIKNHKFFILFIVWTLASCLLVGFFLVRRTMACWGQHSGRRRHRLRGHDLTTTTSSSSLALTADELAAAAANLEFCHEVSAPGSFIALMFLGIEAVLFGLFTAIMLWDQLDNVCRDSSYLETLANEDANPCDWRSVEFVFGPASWRWLFPVAPVVRKRDPGPKEI